MARRGHSATSLAAADNIAHSARADILDRLRRSRGRPPERQNAIAGFVDGAPVEPPPPVASGACSARGTPNVARPRPRGGARDAPDVIPAETSLSSRSNAGAAQFPRQVYLVLPWFRQFSRLRLAKIWSDICIDLELPICDLKVAWSARPNIFRRTYCQNFSSAERLDTKALLPFNEIIVQHKR